MSTLLLALTSIALSVAAQFMLKAGMGSDGVRQALAAGFGPHNLLQVLSNTFVFGGFVLYGIGAVVWLGVLSNWDVSKAYPLVGLGFVLTLVIGYWAGEPITPARTLGVALICAGVVLVGRS